MSPAGAAAVLGSDASSAVGVGLLWVIDAGVASDPEFTGGRVEPAGATELLMTCGGIVGRLRAITEGDFASPITAGPAAGIGCPNAFVVDFSAVFFSGDLPRPATAGTEVGTGARALCKALAKLLEPGLPDGNGTADLLGEPDDAPSI